jgi:tetratricopeptide (TPR) repeat protein
MDTSDATPRLGLTTCSRCGLQSTLASAFVTRRPRDGGGRLCPRCASRARVEDAERLFTRVLLNAGIAFALGLGAFGPAWFIGNVSVGLAVATIVATVWHELGHAVVAKLLVFDVFRIVLGIGPQLLAVPFLGFRWKIRKYPLGGGVHTATRHERGRLWRTIAMTAAGPLSNLLLAAAGVLVFTRSSYFENPFAGPAPLGCLVLINAIAGISNLVPFKTQSGSSSDGRSIWLALTRREEARRELRDKYYWLKLFELLEADVSEEAKATVRDAIESNPTSPVFWTFLGAQQMAQRRYRDARAAFESALEHSKDVTHTAMFQSNLAFALLAGGDPSEHSRGEELSARAYDVLPWRAAVAHTRGSYLILTGRPAEAIAAIEQVLDEEIGDSLRKEILYTLALACQRSSNLERAAELRALAEQLSGDVLRCVERADAAQSIGATAV